MSEEKNPYLEEIRKKVNTIADKICETLQADETVHFEEFKCNWEYNNTGCVWLEIERLRTWQFQDDIKKAYVWEAEQKAKKAAKVVVEEKSNITKVLELQNELSKISRVYVHWDRLADYYTYKKAERKLIKKLQKLEYVHYYKPAYVNYLDNGFIGAPDATILGDSNYGKILVPLNCIDLEKTIQEYYRYSK